MQTTEKRSRSKRRRESRKRIAALLGEGIYSHGEGVLAALSAKGDYLHSGAMADMNATGDSTPNDGCRISLFTRPEIAAVIAETLNEHKAPKAIPRRRRGEKVLAPTFAAPVPRQAGQLTEYRPGAWEFVANV